MNPPAVTITFTSAKDGAQLTMTIEASRSGKGNQRLERTSIGNIGGGHVIVLDDLTVIPVACGAYYEDLDDPDWHHTDPPNGNRKTPAIIEGEDGTKHQMPIDTEVWRLR